MSSNTKKDHDSFTIKMSEMKCVDGLNYAIIIKEDGKSVYNASLNRATTLTVKANRNSSYEVIIDNNSTESLKFRVSINSYKR
jgi:possible peptidase M56